MSRTDRPIRGSIRSCGGSLAARRWRSWRSARRPVAAAADPDPAAADAPHFVADDAGIDHRYEGDFQYFVGGGVAAFDCDDDGRSELFFAGGSAPAALYHNDSPTGGALAFTQLASPVTDLDAVTGAYPLDIDGDGHTDLAVLRAGEDEILRGLGGCRFERADEALGIDDADTWTVAFSATWEGSNELPTLAFGGYLAPDRESCADSRLLRPAADRRRVRAGGGAGARLLHVVDAVQRLEPLRPARPADDERPALLPRRERSAVAHRAWRGAAALHRPPTGGARSRSGAWASPARTSPATATPRCSSRARATTSCRPSPPGPASRRTRTSRWHAGRPPTGPSRAATCCRRRPGTISSPTSTTTASPTCSSPRATSRPRRATPRATPATC